MTVGQGPHGRGAAFHVGRACSKVTEKTITYSISATTVSINDIHFHTPHTPACSRVARRKEQGRSSGGERPRRPGEAMRSADGNVVRVPLALYTAAHTRHQVCACVCVGTNVCVLRVCVYTCRKFQGFKFSSFNGKGKWENKQED